MQYMLPVQGFSKSLHTTKPYEILLLCCVVSSVDSTMKLIVDLVANLGFGGNTPGTPDKEDIFGGSNNAQ